MPENTACRSVFIRCPWALVSLAILLGLAACGGDEWHEERGSAILTAGEVVDTPQSLEPARAVYALSVNQERLLAVSEAGRVPAFLELPDGLRLDYRVTHVEGDPPRVWRGELVSGEQRLSGLTLSRSGHRLAGGFQVADQRFRLASREEGGHLLVEMAPEEPPPYGEPLREDGQ